MFLESTGFVGLTDAQSELVSHWYACERTSNLPYRASLDPGAIKAHLSSISMVEITETGRVRFRLAGSRLRSILGQEMRGRYLDSLRADIADMWSLGLDTALDRQEPVGGMIDHGRACHAWLRLPLQSDGIGALILCHDELVPKARLNSPVQQEIHTKYPSDSSFAA